jgi:hypothetical protein
MFRRFPPPWSIEKIMKAPHILREAERETVAIRIV